VAVPASELSKLYQDTRDLISKMKASEKLSAERNERDRKGYKKTYDDLILRLGNLYKPPILSEEDQEQDIDCLALVKPLIPELSVDAVNRLALVLRKNAGAKFEDPLMNGILRKFHRVRYPM
jgi:hypothetical protein